MSVICSESCPIEIAKSHALEISDGVNGDEHYIGRGLPTTPEKADMAFNSSFDKEMANQSCEISCRALRAVIYSRSLGGDSPRLLRTLAAFGEEI